MERVAAIPSSCGMRMSISTTSGTSSRASETASTPVAASATTRKPGWESNRCASDWRSSFWSSAIRTRISGTDRLRIRQLGLESETVRGAVVVEVPAQRGDALPQSDQAAARPGR